MTQVSNKGKKEGRRERKKEETKEVSELRQY